MLLNEKVSCQQHDPNFMKQNRTNTCVNRRKGAGRKSTTRSSCDLRAQCWPINSLCLSSMWWQSIISPHRKAGTGTFPSSGTLCLGPNRDSRPQVRKPCLQIPANSKRKAQQSSLCRLFLLLQEKRLGPVCSLSPRAGTMQTPAGGQHRPQEHPPDPLLAGQPMTGSPPPRRALVPLLCPRCGGPRCYDPLSPHSMWQECPSVPP